MFAGRALNYLNRSYFLYGAVWEVFHRDYSRRSGRHSYPCRPVGGLRNNSSAPKGRATFAPYPSFLPGHLDAMVTSREPSLLRSPPRGDFEHLWTPFIAFSHLSLGGRSGLGLRYGPLGPRLRGERPYRRPGFWGRRISERYHLFYSRPWRREAAYPICTRHYSDRGRHGFRLPRSRNRLLSLAQPVVFPARIEHLEARFAGRLSARRGSHASKT